MKLNHLAVIMDGNRRWAKQHSVSLLYDDSSARAVDAAVSFCQERGIKYLSLYTLSTENLENRDPALLNRLFDMLFELCTTKKQECIDNNVSVRFVGQRELFPEQLRAAITGLERDTASCDGLYLNLLFCYGGQQELAAACQKVAKKVAQGDLTSENITPQVIAQHLWTAPHPAPDLIIRTGGNTRLSNFLLFQAAYSELHFVDYLWPEMSKERLAQCVATFEQAEQNYGA